MKESCVFSAFIGVLNVTILYPNNSSVWRRETQMQRTTVRSLKYIQYVNKIRACTRYFNNGALLSGFLSLFIIIFALYLHRAIVYTVYILYLVIYSSCCLTAMI